MRIVITTETLYDTDLGTPLVWESDIRAEELTALGGRRLLNLDNTIDGAAYEQIALLRAGKAAEA